MKLKYDKLLSNFACDVNSRHYTQGFQNRSKVREAEAKAYGAHEQAATEAVLARAGLPKPSVSASFAGSRHGPPPGSDAAVAAAAAAPSASGAGAAFHPSFAPSTFTTPESALLNVAVNSLETLAVVLNARPAGLCVICLWSESPNGLHPIWSSVHLM